VISSAALALAIPSYFVSPALANTIILFALPPHLGIGLKHVVKDYTNIQPMVVAVTVTVILFLALLFLQTHSVGITGVIAALWSH